MSEKSLADPVWKLIKMYDPENFRSSYSKDVGKKRGNNQIQYIVWTNGTCGASITGRI